MLRSALTSVGVRALVLAVALAVVMLAPADGPPAEAVEPGVNCSSYDGTTCVVEIGDIWFCNVAFSVEACPTSVRAGDTVRWDYANTGLFFHTTTDCGIDCDSPTGSPLWDSDRLLPGESYEFTFDTPGTYLYYCTIHPSTQRGTIRVLESATTPTPGSISTSTPTATAPTPTATPPTPTATPSTAAAIGDVNCNSNVDSIDAALVLQLVAGLVDTLSCEENADTNADGTTNSIDAALILQFTAGLIDTLPV